jgi:hypothetical protein
MATPLGLVRELIGDLFRLGSTFTNDVLLGVDPLTAVSFLVGQALVIGAVGLLGYLALGALAREFGIDFPALGDVGPRPRRWRGPESDPGSE